MTRPNGLDCLGFDISKDVPWGDIARTADGVGKVVLNVYAPGAGTALSENVVRPAIDAADGKKASTTPGATPAPKPPTPGSPAAKQVETKAAEVEHTKIVEASSSRTRTLVYAGLGVLGAGVLGTVLWRVIR